MKKQRVLVSCIGSVAFFIIFFGMNYCFVWAEGNFQSSQNRDIKTIREQNMNRVITQAERRLAAEHFKANSVSAASLAEYRAALASAAANRVAELEFINDPSVDSTVISEAAIRQAEAFDSERRQMQANKNDAYMGGKNE